MPSIPILDSASIAGPVSVIVPARNNGATLSATIRSCQKDPAVGEVIVVVHASADDTLAVAKSHEGPRVRVIEDDRLGISRAMNVGMATSTGAYLAKIDADDLVPAGRFTTQAHFLDRNPEFLAVCGLFDTIDEMGRHLRSFAKGRSAGEVTQEYLGQRRPTHFGAWLCRREGWEQVGGFREWFATAEDLDMPFRLAMAGRIWLDPIPAYSYRIRAGSITRSSGRSELAFYELASIDFARQRLATGTDDLEKGIPPRPPSDEPKARTENSLFHEQTVGHLTARAWDEFHAGARGVGLQILARSVGYAEMRRKPAQFWELIVMGLKSIMPRTNR